MRLFATITLIAVTSSSTIHWPTGVAKSTGVRIVFRTVLAVGKRCAISSESGIVGHECAVGGRAIWVRAARALAFAWLRISTITSATAAAVATRAAGAILLLGIRDYCIRVHVDCDIGTWGNHYCR